MPLPIYKSIIVILVAAACTFLTRFIPFLLFGGNKPLPIWLEYLGKALPPAIMATLVVYCFKDISFDSVVNFVPAIIAGGVTAALHIWKRNFLISMAAGTILYMVLIRVM